MTDERGRGRPQKYPWDEWGNGERQYVTQSVDFPDCSLVSFRALVHRTAREKFNTTADTDGLNRKTGTINFRIHREKE